MFRNLVFGILGALIAFGISYYYYTSELRNAKLAIVNTPIVSFTTFNSAAENDKHYYCLHYSAVKGWADTLQSSLESENSYDEYELERAQKTISNFKSLEQDNLRYDCKTI